jgi:hypothetical protein
MSNELDERLGQLLRQDAPPVRDPMFRIALLERRERQRYQRRQRMVLASAAVLAVLFAVMVTLNRTLGDRMWMVLLAAVFCTAALVASAVSIRGVLQVVRHLRGR